jgi:hypothetical protein
MSVQRLLLLVASIGIGLAAWRVDVTLSLLWFGWSLYGTLAGPPESVFYRRLMIFLTGYYLLSTTTLPFLDSWWIGEIPPLALIQLPKLSVAEQLRSGAVLQLLSRVVGSLGSYSPDFHRARPYALAIVYVVPLLSLWAVLLLRSRHVGPYRTRFLVLSVSALLDFAATLALGSTRTFSLY